MSHSSLNTRMGHDYDIFSIFANFVFFNILKPTVFQVWNLVQWLFLTMMNLFYLSSILLENTTRSNKHKLSFPQKWFFPHNLKWKQNVQKHKTKIQIRKGNVQMWMHRKREGVMQQVAVSILIDTNTTISNHFSASAKIRQYLFCRKFFE